MKSEFLGEESDIKEAILVLWKSTCCLTMKLCLVIEKESGTHIKGRTEGEDKIE